MTIERATFDREKRIQSVVFIVPLSNLFMQPLSLLYHYSSTTTTTTTYSIHCLSLDPALGTAFGCARTLRLCRAFGVSGNYCVPELRDCVCATRYREMSSPVSQ